jgi:hypothetical protein
MLCERCDQLRLDNLEKTHASCSSEDGKRVVDYRAVQDFAYSFVDRAPGFPSLEASEKVGCELCAMLRSELATSHLKDYDGEVNVRYRYLLQDAYIQGPKYPGALVVNVEPDDPSQQELGNVYVFSIHSHQGWYLSRYMTSGSQALLERLADCCLCRMRPRMASNHSMARTGRVVGKVSRVHQ